MAMSSAISLGALHSGRWVVVCEVFRDGGVAPTTGTVSPSGMAIHFVGAPPSGRWVVVCKAQSRRGRRSHKKAFMHTSSARIDHNL